MWQILLLRLSFMEIPVEFDSETTSIDDIVYQDSSRSFENRSFILAISSSASCRQVNFELP